MYIPFDQMPGHSRIWIYQSEKPLGKTGEEVASRLLEKFCEQWSAHGSPLKTSYLISHNQFVILAADDKVIGPSGCSIDSSVNFLKNLQTELKVDLFNRTMIAFFKSGMVQLFPLNSLKGMFEEGKLKPGDCMFNNLLGTKLEWEKNWLLPCSESWLARFIPQTPVA